MVIAVKNFVPVGFLKVWLFLIIPVNLPLAEDEKELAALEDEIDRAVAELFGITKAELEDVREVMRVYTVTDKVAGVKAKHKKGLRAI